MCAEKGQWRVRQCASWDWGVGDPRTVLEWCVRGDAIIGMGWRHTIKSALVIRVALSLLSSTPYPKSMMETCILSTKAPSLRDEPYLVKIAPRRGLGCAGNESPIVSSLTTSYESEEETLGTLAPPAIFIGQLSNLKLVIAEFEILPATYNLRTS